MKVSIEVAMEMLHEGKYVKNTRVGPEEPELVWKAKYSVHFRPNGQDKIAIVEEI